MSSEYFDLQSKFMWNQLFKSFEAENSDIETDINFQFQNDDPCENQSNCGDSGYSSVSDVTTDSCDLRVVKLLKKRK
jgi:hypothetical protein